MRVYLHRVRLNKGGYDRYGMYFGIGAPLYAWCACETGDGGHIRARSRADAKAQIRTKHPDATFFK